MVRGPRGNDLPDDLTIQGASDLRERGSRLGVVSNENLRNDDGVGLVAVEGRLVGEAGSRQILAPPEFDEVDLEIVREALKFSRTDMLLAFLILVSTMTILILSHIGYAGTPYHGAVAVLLLGATLTYVYRVWQVF